MKLNIITILTCTIIISSCANKSEKANETNPTTQAVAKENEVSLNDAQWKNAKIETATLQQKKIASILKLNGKIEVMPQSILSVSVPLGGYLKSTKLMPGMFVNKGEAIAVIEDQQFIQLQQDYLMAKSKLHFATLDYNRQKDLNESRSSSDKALQQAQAEMQQQRILLSSLSEKLKLIGINPDNVNETNITKRVNVYASISGFVSKINSNPGKYVAPTDILFEIIDQSKIYLNLKAFEKDINSLSLNQRISAYSNANPEQKIEGKILLMNKNIDESGIAEVYCSFDKTNRNIIPGMYMNAEIQVESSLAYTLPENSVVNFEGKNFVFVETNAKNYAMLEVQTGNNDKGFIEILNHETLNGKAVVTQGAYTLLMKMKNSEE